MPRKRPASKQCIFTKQDGNRCGSWAVVGGEFCRKHAHCEKKRGINAPNFKHGRYSASLPQRLVQHYERARADETLLELRDEIAVLDTRSKELQAKLSTLESGVAWKELKVNFKAFQAAMKAGDGVAVSEALSEIEKLINQGVGEYVQWKEQMEVFKLRKELVESERKRLLELKQFMTIERVMNLATALTMAVREEVNDPTALGMIAEKFGRLLNRITPAQSGQDERAARIEAHEIEVIESNPVFR